jgi:hypothetical protein
MTPQTLLGLATAKTLVQRLILAFRFPRILRLTAYEWTCKAKAGYILLLLAPTSKHKSQIKCAKEILRYRFSTGG